MLAGYPKVVAICPTYQRPQLVANVLACFLSQNYPRERCHLVICEDGGQFAMQKQDNWEVLSIPERIESLPAKFNVATDYARQNHAPDLIVVMEDDDVYLPNYLADHARWSVLEDRGWSKCGVMLSDYQLPPDERNLNIESTAGRGHGCMALTPAVWEQAGGWPATQVRHFDQMFLGRLGQMFPKGGIYPGIPQYVYRWQTTGVPHAQAFMHDYGDEWYIRAERPRIAEPTPLEPVYDATTARYYLDYAGRAPVGKPAHG